MEHLKNEDSFVFYPGQYEHTPVKNEKTGSMPQFDLPPTPPANPQGMFLEAYSALAPLGLQPVVLQKWDTCWTYCMKRIGWNMWFGDLSGIALGFSLDYGYKQFSKPVNESVSADHNLIEKYFNLVPIRRADEGRTVFEVLHSSLDPNAKDTVLQVGDLLLYSHREERHIYGDRISAEGIVEYTSHNIRRHVAVYEGDGKVSHAVFAFNGPDNKYIAGLEIRVDYMRDLEHYPTHVLKLKQQ